MKATSLGAIIGFLIPTLWIIMGFWSMLLILVLTLVGAGLGMVLGRWFAKKGITSPRAAAVIILDKITN